jgi:hypothetical protein
MRGKPKCWSFKYRSYIIKIKPYRGAFLWDIVGISGYTGKRAYFGGGIVLDDNKKVALAVAKDYVNKELQHL